MPGTLEIVCGPMFGGKTELVLHHLRRAKIAKQEIIVFKPAVDTRYGKNKVASHIKNEIECVSVPQGNPEWILDRWLRNVSNAGEKLDFEWGAQVVAIDEAQFFAPSIVDVCQTLADAGLRVIVAGLDQDYMGRPFGAMPQLMAVADKVEKLTAICTVCGQPATRTQRLTASHDLVQLGATGTYDARCRAHHTIPNEIE